VVACRNVSYFEPRTDVVRDEVDGKLLVKVKLVIAQQTDNRSNTKRSRLLDPGVNRCLRHKLTMFPGIARAAAPRKLSADHPRKHVFCRFCPCCLSMRLSECFTVD